MKKTKRIEYLFRGTALGWQGNNANKLLPRTSITTHPVKATLFALACTGNNRVIYINKSDKVTHLKEDKNVLAAIEDEISFEIQPVEYAAVCDGYLLVEDAINILKELGQVIPQLLDRTLFDMALKDVGKVNAKIAEGFYESAKKYLRKA